MKRLSLALAILGLAASTVLVAWYGVGRVADAVLSVGFGGFALLLAWQAVLFAVLGLAWGSLLPGVHAWVPIWGRMVRDAAGNCLPFSQVGGYVLGARAVTLHGVDWPRATGSTVVDVTAEFLAQLLFATFGLLVLVWHQPESVLVWPVTAGLGLALAGGGAFIWLQSGAAPVLRFLGRHIVGDRFGDAGARVEALQAELNALYRRRWRLARAVALHLGGWVCSGIASWISYRLLDAPITLLDALAIEALLTAALSLAFAVPGYAGVQEAAFAGLGAVYGLAPDISLGVSILRRARDLAVGIPILVIWQWVETRRLRQRAPAAAD